MAVTAAQLNQLYLAYFGRPADFDGLTFYTANPAATITSVAANFSASPESQAMFGTSFGATQINAIYQNLFNRSAELAGITYWAGEVAAGRLTAAGAALAILQGAQNADKTSVDNKLALATAFVAALDTAPEIIGYSGAAAAASARAFLQTVDSTAASVTAANAALTAQVAAAVALGSTGVPGSTFNLTTGVDVLVGTAANDVFNASVTGTSATLGGLDSIDGGSGNDIFNIADTATAGTADFALPAGMVIKNVETVNVTTNGAIGTPGGTAFDVSGLTGLTSFSGVAAGAGTATGSNVKAAGTTDVKLTVSGANTTAVTGGKSVSITGGGASTIADAAGATGTTLTSVTLTSVNGAASITGNGVTSLTLAGATTAARTTTITNAAAHTLTVNAAGTGYLATGVEAQSVVVDSVATAATINTSSKSSVDLTGSTAVKAITLTGSGALKLAALASATSVDGSAATGALTLGDLNAGTVTIKTGSGNDSLAIQATAKTTVETGAGNDTVTLKSALAATSTITLGAGDDKVLFGTGGSVAVSTSTVIDGGEGTDTVSANLITSGNAAQFKNFETVSLDSTTGLDLALLTGTTLTGLSIDATSTNATYQNVKVAQSLNVTFVGDNSGITNTLTFSDATGTADTYAINFNAAAATTAATSASVKAGTVAAAGIEAFTIASGGTNQWNSLTLGADTSAKTVTITGASNLDLAFSGTFGSTAAPATGVSSIDGSAATGKLAINIANVVAATAGLTVKGGTAADTLTTSTFKSTLTGGAGADTFVATAAVTGTTTAPVITSITDAASGDKIQFANKGTETFNATKVDVSTATALFGGTTNALDLASTVDGSTNANIRWFQYAGDTYIIEDTDASTTAFSATDVVIKITGLVDLATATLSNTAGAPILTLA